MADLERVFKKGVLLAETYEKVQPPPDITNWWVSEKLDGVRAYWNGRDFFSRNGLLFEAPAWFKVGLPEDTHLDGELWCGREAFERCVGIIKYQKGSTASEWKNLVFLCFDAPVVGGREDLPYEERVAAIEAVTQGCEYARGVNVRRCGGRAHLDELLQSVLAHGGEGLMLREPESQYVRVRSKSLLKVKTFQDAEAKVVGYSKGDRRLSGMLGALQCEMPLSGVRFEVGTGFTDAMRNWLGAKRRWPLGSVISYKYQNLTKKGVPRFPVYLRERADKSWDEVVADAANDVADKEGGPPSIARAPSLMAGAPAAASTPEADAIVTQPSEKRSGKRARASDDIEPVIRSSEEGAEYPEPALLQQTRAQRKRAQKPRN